MQSVVFFPRMLPDGFQALGREATKNRPGLPHDPHGYDIQDRDCGRIRGKYQWSAANGADLWGSLAPDPHSRTAGHATIGYPISSRRWLR